MKVSKVVWILVLAAFLKLSLSGLYFYYARTGRLSLKPALALAEVKKDQAPDPSRCPEELFRALRVERERLARERARLEQRRKELDLLEKQVKRRLASLASLEQELDRKLAELRTLKNERFKLLVGVYSTMKPSKAARLLEAMEPEMAIKILSALKTDQVARILSAMPPEKAASLAESLSGLPPREM